MRRADSGTVSGETGSSASTQAWSFHVSEACDARLYGYRGPLLDWDYFAQVGLLGRLCVTNGRPTSTVLSCSSGGVHCGDTMQYRHMMCMDGTSDMVRPR